MLRPIALLSFLGPLACGVVAKPQLSEIEIADSFGGSLERTRYKFDYSSGGKIDTITRLTGTTEDGVLQYAYDGDKVETVTWLVDEQENYTIAFTYKDDRVSEITITDAGQTDGEIWTLDYVDDRLSQISTDGTLFRVEYDDQDRVERTTEDLEGLGSTISTFSYEDPDDDDDGFGELKTVEMESGGEPESITFGYDDARRLQRVSQDAYSERVTYNDDGLAEEIVRSLSGSEARTTTRLTYGEGRMEGVRPMLPLTYGQFFTLDGRRVDQVDPVAAWMLGD